MHLMSPSVPVLWCDDLSIVSLASNPVFHERTKNIELDMHFIQEIVLAKDFVGQHIQSYEKTTNILTKPLSIQAFLKL